MCAFVVLDFGFSIPIQEIGLGNVSEMTYLPAALREAQPAGI